MKRCCHCRSNQASYVILLGIAVFLWSLLLSFTTSTLKKEHYTCPTIYTPVCNLANGANYWNECYARLYDVRSIQAGTCNPVVPVDRRIDFVVDNDVVSDVDDGFFNGDGGTSDEQGGRFMSCRDFRDCQNACENHIEDQFPRFSRQEVVQYCESATASLVEQCRLSGLPGSFRCQWLPEK